MTTSTTLFTPPPPEPAGNGHLHLSHPHHARFATLRASYPLKLLAPNALPSQSPNVALAYLLAYGGGLVAGDRVQLAVTVDASCGLVLLTQGSTKVYKHRLGLRPKSHLLRGTTEHGVNGEAPLTRQRMHVKVDKDAFLLLMPDTVSPFRDSRYAQAQRIVLAEGASALVLDWVNSGRGHRPASTRYVVKNKAKAGGDVAVESTTNGDGADGEAVNGTSDGAGDDKDQDNRPPPPQTDSRLADPPLHPAHEEVWAMAYYASTNEIVSPKGAVVARERMVLDNAGHPTGTTSTALSPVARRLAPYHIYATVLAYGPHLALLRALLEGIADATSQFQLPCPPGLVWSYSPLDDEGGVLRVAGLEVEDVRTWLRTVLSAGGVAALVGEGLWPRCL